MEIPEADAQQKVAEATEGAADAISDLTNAGARKEAIEASRQILLQAESAKELAHNTYTRIQRLYDEGVMSAQKRDEALTAYKVTEAQVATAKAQYEIVKTVRASRKACRAKAGAGCQECRRCGEVGAS